MRFLKIGIMVTIDRLWLYRIDFNNKMLWTSNWYDYIVEYDYNESDYKGSWLYIFYIFFFFFTILSIIYFNNKGKINKNKINNNKVCLILLLPKYCYINLLIQYFLNKKRLIFKELILFSVEECKKILYSLLNIDISTGL
jgi:hypothetical protein